MLNLSCTPLIIHKAIIEFIDNKQLKLDYLTSDETWILYKIDKEININLNDSSILKETLNRSLNIKCNDYRTDEEIQKDTLLKEIDFQF